MGVLNVTPDSFSDGGRWLEATAAVARGHQMIAEGADVIDVGGESTRPGAEPVEAAEECRRVLAVVEELAPYVRVSIDTRKAEVARAAVEAGATIINDVSASLAAVAAQSAVAWVAMHMQGHPATMQQSPRYRDVVAEVTEFLVTRADEAAAAGVTEVWIDPGIGFGKTGEHNLALLRSLSELTAGRYPVLVGSSRKSFLGSLLSRGFPPTTPEVKNLSRGFPPTVSEPVDRREGSLATAVWAMSQGARMVRVHDVAPAVAAAKLFAGNFS